MTLTLPAALRSADFWRRLIQLNLGLMTFGVAISLVLRASLGLDPWSVLHEGASELSGWSFGRVTQLIGLGLMAVNFWALGVKPGLGTLLNMLLVGPWVDVFEAQRWLPVVAPGEWLAGLATFGAGLALMGLAIGLYISAGFGAGPRDDFVLGCARKLGASVRVVRGGLELSVLALGFLLGGTVGVGTLLFALSIGPVMQLFLRLFRYERAPASAPAGAD